MVNWRFGLIKPDHTQYCSPRGCIRPVARVKRYSIFKEISITKTHLNLNILQILQPKKENFQKKEI